MSLLWALHTQGSMKLELITSRGLNPKKILEGDTRPAPVGCGGAENFTEEKKGCKEMLTLDSSRPCGLQGSLHCPAQSLEKG